MKIKGGIGETSINLLHIVVHLIYVFFVLLFGQIIHLDSNQEINFLNSNHLPIYGDYICLAK